MPERSPAFQWYPEKWEAPTSRLSDSSYRVYHRILNWMWMNSPNQCSIADDPEAIAVALAIDKEKAAAALAEIQNKHSPLLKHEEGRLVSNGLRKEVKKQAQWSRKSREGGLASAKARAAQYGSASPHVLVNHPSQNCEPPVNQTRTTCEPPREPPVNSLSPSPSPSLSPSSSPILNAELPVIPTQGMGDRGGGVTPAQARDRASTREGACDHAGASACTHVRARRKRAFDEPLPDLPPELAHGQLPDLWARWVSHKAAFPPPKRVHASGAAASFRIFSRWGIERACRAIEASLANGWEGIHEPAADRAARPAAKPPFQNNQTNR